MADYLNTVAQWLAEEEDRKKRRPAREERLVSIEGAPAGRASYLSYMDDGQGNLAGKEGEIPEGYLSSLAGAGYRVADAASMQEARARMGQARPPPGKLPFISGVPVHQAPRGYPGPIPPVGDQGMAKAMSLAAAARPGTKAAPPAVPAQPASPRLSSSREVQVGLTSQGVQPQLRVPTERPYSAPAAGSADRFLGLPDGVATFMRQRSGLSGAQEDANRRALGVELASALNQVGSGISGAQYQGNAWEDQRQAAGQPVADYLLRDEEERRARQEQRAVEQDELAAREAAREAELELQRFQYGQQRDKSEDALARERMQSERDIANARLRSEALDRAQREREAKMRAGATQSEINERARLNRELRQQGVDEKDLQKLAERAQPGAEMVEDIDYLNSVIREGGRDFDAIPGVGPVAGLMPEVFRSTEGDKVAQAASRLASNIILAKSGKAATDAERKFLLASYGIKPGTTEAAWTEGIKALARDAQVSMQNIEAGFRPEIVLERANRGGTTASAVPGPVSMPTGEEIDMPDGSVYEVLEDGTTRRKR